MDKASYYEMRARKALERQRKAEALGREMEAQRQKEIRMDYARRLEKISY